MLIVSSSSDWSRRPRLDVFSWYPVQTSCHAPHLLNFTWRALVSPSSRARTRGILAGSQRACCRDRPQVSCRPAQSELAFHSTTPPLSSALCTSLMSYWLSKREMCDSAWRLLSVARSLSFTCTMISPMRCPEKSFKQKESRVQFERCPECHAVVSTIHGENRAVQKHPLQSRSRHLSRFQAGHVKAAQRTKVLHFSRVSPQKGIRNITPMRLRHHLIEETS